jgi:hypothetical protein
MFLEMELLIVLFRAKQQESFMLDQQNVPRRTQMTAIV